MSLPALDQAKFQQWFIDNIDVIYPATGIVHYNASNVGMLKLLFLQQMQIEQLQSLIKNNNNEWCGINTIQV